MSSNRNILYFLRNINRKHRLSLRKEHDNSEVWYMHISPMKIVGGVFALILILFILILLLLVYTPTLSLVPGYPGNRIREEMVHNIMRVDSLERTLLDLQVYNDNIVLMLDGKTPITRNVQQAGDSLAAVGIAPAIPPSAEDSLLRRQMEGDGIYSLSSAAAAHNKSRAAVELMSPVKGIIVHHFSPKDGRYGTAIATAINAQVMAMDQGTIILSTWSPDEGYIIQIQHDANYVSVYKRNTKSLKSVGMRVAAGEVIGFTGEGVHAEAEKGLFEFQLWQNGIPIDPESYIVF